MNYSLRVSSAQTKTTIRGHVDELLFFWMLKTFIFCLHTDLYIMAWRWREFLETWGEKKEKGLFRFVLWDEGKNPRHA